MGPVTFGGRRRRAAAAVAASLLLGGCYTGHAASGGLRLLAQRRPVERVLADPGTPPELAERLAAARRIVEFAVRELALPAGRSYSTYVELDRPYVVWTVTAAPELSVEPVTWCFPVAGCVAYRGYFSAERAERFAARLARRGLDVDTGGVRAYSTLGWFSDPLTSSILDLGEAELAGLLFHELAHRRLYVADDTAFNESFATAVEEAGVERWLGDAGRRADLAAWRERRRQDEEIVRLALAARGRLATIYAAPESDAWKRRRKAEELAALAADYRRGRAGWGDRWDGFFDDGLDNARLAGLVAYHELVPDFRRLLDGTGGDLDRFYAAAEALAALDPAARRARLAGG